MRERLARTLSDGKVTLTFVHPTSPSETLKASVSLDSTPRYLVEQLIAANFIPPPDSTGQYKLRTKDGRQLLDDAEIAAAGVADQSHLVVESSMTGAVAGRR